MAKPIDEKVPTSPWKTLFEIFTTAIMVIAAVALVWANRSKIIPPPPPPELEVPTDHIAIDGAPSLGSAGAKVAIVEFAEFQCPFCGVVARDVFPEIEKDFIEPGRVRLIHKTFPLPGHSLAIPAARAALCAHRQGKFWSFHDELFAKTTKLSNERLAEVAAGLGLDMPNYEACRNDPSIGKAVDGDTAQAKALKVSGTPTFYFGIVQASGKVKAIEAFSGAKPVDRFRAVLDRLVAETQRD